MRILIVDDHTLVRDGVASLVSAWGHEVVGLAGNEDEAVEQALRVEPDLVLMDIRMPDMNGTEALRQLKDDERTAQIPIVALTSSTMLGDQERFLGDGFDGYLRKPISVRDFPDQVREHLRLP
jgi:two-component system cell cycle response regulator DivK